MWGRVCTSPALDPGRSLIHLNQSIYFLKRTPNTFNTSNTQSTCSTAKALYLCTIHFTFWVVSLIPVCSILPCLTDCPPMGRLYSLTTDPPLTSSVMSPVWVTPPCSSPVSPRSPDVDSSCQVSATFSLYPSVPSEWQRENVCRILQGRE